MTYKFQQKFIIFVWIFEFFQSNLIVVSFKYIEKFFFFMEKENLEEIYCE